MATMAVLQRRPTSILRRGRRRRRRRELAATATSLPTTLPAMTSTWRPSKACASAPVGTLWATPPQAPADRVFPWGGGTGSRCPPGTELRLGVRPLSCGPQRSEEQTAVLCGAR
ncbi:unnamed protein product [Boreogadus saida]